MITINKDAKQYYMSEDEFRVRAFRRNWIDDFEVGDIIHVESKNGNTKTMEIKLIKQAVDLK